MFHVKHSSDRQDNDKAAGLDAIGLGVETGGQHLVVDDLPLESAHGLKRLLLAAALDGLDGGLCLGDQDGPTLGPVTGDVQDESGPLTGRGVHRQPGQLLQCVQDLAVRADETARNPALVGVDDRDRGPVAVDVDIQVAVEVANVKKGLQEVSGDLPFLLEQVSGRSPAGPAGRGSRALGCVAIPVHSRAARVLVALVLGLGVLSVHVLIDGRSCRPIGVGVIVVRDLDLLDGDRLDAGLELAVNSEWRLGNDVSGFLVGLAHAVSPSGSGLSGLGASWVVGFWAAGGADLPPRVRSSSPGTCRSGACRLRRSGVGAIGVDALAARRTVLALLARARAGALGSFLALGLLPLATGRLLGRTVAVVEADGLGGKALDGDLLDRL